jgi:hypothetical protein
MAAGVLRKALQAEGAATGATAAVAGAAAGHSSTATVAPAAAPTSAAARRTLVEGPYTGWADAVDVIVIAAAMTAAIKLDFIGAPD